MKPSIAQALISLGVVRDVVRIVGDTYEGIEWVEKPTHTKKQVEAELKRLQTEYDSKNYQKLRVAEYPSIGDQLDALFHAGVFPTEMSAKIQTIKDKYPKSE